MAAAEQPGAAFLRRRLARAQAVPPAERSPEVQAFITSVELGRQGCELLPLLRSGRGGEARAALPLGDPATARRVLPAVLKMVQADHLCPEYAVFDPDLSAHLDSYYAALDKAAMRGRSRELACVLIIYLQLSRDDSLAAEERARATASQPALLASPSVRAVICRQLQQLSAEQPEGQLPFTWLQLEGACQAALIYEATRDIMHVPAAAAPPAAQRHTAEEAQLVLQAAAGAWRQLEPSNLKAVAATAIAAPHNQPDPQYLPSLRRALQPAQQQHSPYWVVRCASQAVLSALAVPCEADTLKAIFEEFSQAEPALRSCRRLLPDSWMQGLSTAHRTATTALPLLRSRLAALDSGAAGLPQAAIDISAGRQQAANFRAAIIQQRQELDSGNKCAGCGKQAVGLRACSRCRAVKYCSVECQRAAWPQHKRDCRPA